MNARRLTLRLHQRDQDDITNIPDLFTCLSRSLANSLRDSSIQLVKLEYLAYNRTVRDLASELSSTQSRAKFFEWFNYGRNAIRTGDSPISCLTLMSKLTSDPWSCIGLNIIWLSPSSMRRTNDWKMFETWKADVWKNDPLRNKMLMWIAFETGSASLGDYFSRTSILCTSHKF